MKRGRSSSQTQEIIPEEPVRGREAATERILEAAEQLFAEMTPKDVTTRAIAEKAQVNLALIHRYVGSKEEVLRAVMHRYAARFRADIEGAANLGEALPILFEDVKQVPFLRTLAFLVLTRYPLDDVLSPHGAVSTLIRTSNAESPNKGQELAVLAMGMGWMLFEEFFQKASRTKDPAGMRAEVYTLMRKLLRQKKAKP